MPPELPNAGTEPTIPARHGLLPATLKRDLADLNAQYLDLVAAVESAGDERFALAEPIRRRLAALDAAARRRTAAAPFALFRLVVPPPPPAIPAGIADLAWPVPGVGWPGRCASFAHQAAFFARRLCEGAPLAAQLVLGLAPEAQSQLAGLCPSELACHAAHPGFVRPRWPGHQRFWEMLESAARGDSAVALQWAHCVGVCLIGADAVEVAHGTVPPPRRRPRR